MPVTNDAEGYEQIKKPAILLLLLFYRCFFFALGINKKVEPGFSFKQTLKKRPNYTSSTFLVIS